MRSLGGFCLALLCAGGLYAQRGAAGGHPQTHAPGGSFGTGGMATFGRGIGGAGFGNRGGVGGHSRPAYAYPVFVGGFYNYAPLGYDQPANYDYSSGYAPYGYANQAQQQQPIIVYAPAPATASPVIINMGAPGANGAPPEPAAPPSSAYRESAPPPDGGAEVEPAHYLIALKDHTIYSAVAYWVDGSTLHYFTSGNTHNQVSVALVDRDLTARLNQGSGLQVNLPPAR